MKKDTVHLLNMQETLSPNVKCNHLRAQFSAADCWVDITCYLNAVPATEEPRKEANTQLCVNLLPLQRDLSSLSPL